MEGLAPKLQAAFKEIADIDISDGADGLRSVYDILKDIAEVFPTLNDLQRQYLSEAASGNRQSKVLQAIVSNWDEVEKAVKSATESENSSLKENLVFLESVEGHTNRLSSEWQSFSRMLIDSNTIKSVLDFGTNLLKITQISPPVTKFVAYGAALMGIAAAGKSILKSSIGTSLKEIATSIGRPKYCLTTVNLGFHKCCRELNSIA